MRDEVVAYTLKIRGGIERDRYGKRAGKGALIQWELSGTLGVSQDQTLFAIKNMDSAEAFGDNDMLLGNSGGDAISATLDANYYRGQGMRAGEEREYVAEAREAISVGNGQLNNISMTEQANALDTMHDQQAVYERSQVRRLTPLECERLQGFPDGWTDIGEWTDSKGKLHKDSDSPRYKALGNSIALPFWFFLLRRISAQYERPATLGSLFDGIGGFPYCWEMCNGRGTTLWASEIEEFPIAVTKKRFPEEE